MIISQFSEQGFIQLLDLQKEVKKAINVLSRKFCKHLNKIESPEKIFEEFECELQKSTEEINTSLKLERQIILRQRFGVFRKNIRRYLRCYIEDICDYSLYPLVNNVLESHYSPSKIKEELKSFRKSKNEQRKMLIFIKMYKEKGLGGIFRKIPELEKREWYVNIINNILREYDYTRGYETRFQKSINVLNPFKEFVITYNLAKSICAYSNKKALDVIIIVHAAQSGAAETYFLKFISPIYIKLLKQAFNRFFNSDPNKKNLEKFLEELYSLKRKNISSIFNMKGLLEENIEHAKELIYKGYREKRRSFLKEIKTNPNLIHNFEKYLEKFEHIGGAPGVIIEYCFNYCINKYYESKDKNECLKMKSFLKRMNLLKDMYPGYKFYHKLDGIE